MLPIQAESRLLCLRGWSCGSEGIRQAYQRTRLACETTVLPSRSSLTSFISQLPTNLSQLRYLFTCRRLQVIPRSQKLSRGTILLDDTLAAFSRHSGHFDRVSNQPCRTRLTKMKNSFAIAAGAGYGTRSPTYWSGINASACLSLLKLPFSVSAHSVASP